MGARIAGLVAIAISITAVTMSVPLSAAQTPAVGGVASMQLAATPPMGCRGVVTAAAIDYNQPSET